MVCMTLCFLSMQMGYKLSEGEIQIFTNSIQLSKSTIISKWVYRSSIYFLEIVHGTFSVVQESISAGSEPFLADSNRKLSQTICIYLSISVMNNPCRKSYCSFKRTGIFGRRVQLKEGRVNIRSDTQIDRKWLIPLYVVAVGTQRPGASSLDTHEDLLLMHTVGRCRLSRCFPQCAFGTPRPGPVAQAIS